EVIVPVGNADGLFPAAIVAALNAYVSEPSALVVGVTLLQPRKNVPVVVKTLKRGEPPWHWAALASVNEADVKVWPFAPVMVAPADAFVAVAHGFARWSTPALNVEETPGQAFAGSNVNGSSAAAAVPASASTATTVAASKIFLIVSSLIFAIYKSRSRERGYLTAVSADFAEACGELHISNTS